MKSQKIKNSDVFAISLSGLIPESLADMAYLVYAPLANSALLVTSQQWEKIENVMNRGKMEDEDTMEVVAALSEVDESILEASKVKHEHDFQNLTVLPTNRCNFKCGFCYSSLGRSAEELDPEAAFTAIDYFLNENPHTRLSLSVLGGGEPLMSWPNTKAIIEYAKSKAEEAGKILTVSITTNGSLLSDEIIGFIRENNIVTVVSYEILESIQNIHRGHYQLVKDNIGRMIRQGCLPQFNTVITPDNVALLAEIIDKAHSDFPQVKYICTDPVIRPDLYEDVEELRRYHDEFIVGFFEARALGRRLGVTVDCTANISMDCTIARYCPGEMGVTAHGLITLCPCVSSDKETFFDDFVYGKINRNSVQLDHNKLHLLLNTSGYDSHGCRQCTMKYNCAGGCLYQNKMLKDEFKAETCRFMREFGRMFLYERLNDELVSECGSDIITLLQNELGK